MRPLVLLKGMPVTKGHEALIQFAIQMAPGGITVLMDYAPDEPYVAERYEALRQIVGTRGQVHTKEVIPQRPEDDPNFWVIWKEILADYWYHDTVIGSEPYCETVAEIIGAKYMPFDPNRDLVDTRAREVRGNPTGYFDQICPRMQRDLRTTVTIFGAESTGKTTLAKDLALQLNYAPWVFEYGRPYLETRGTEINVESMEDIWHGQRALQEVAEKMVHDSPWIVRDTDLYTTIGYWEQPHWATTLGGVPNYLVGDAKASKADLYIITRSNIPFEEDPLRYGGDKRESPDEYWIDVAERNKLNYVVLDGADIGSRLTQAVTAARLAAETKTEILRYDRKGA